MCFFDLDRLNPQRQTCLGEDPGGLVLHSKVHNTSRRVRVETICKTPFTTPAMVDRSWFQQRKCFPVPVFVRDRRGRPFMPCDQMRALRSLATHCASAHRLSLCTPAPVNPCLPTTKTARPPVPLNAAGVCANNL